MFFLVLCDFFSLSFFLYLLLSLLPFLPPSLLPLSLSLSISSSLSFFFTVRFLIPVEFTLMWRDIQTWLYFFPNGKSVYQYHLLKNPTLCQWFEISFVIKFQIDLGLSLDFISHSTGLFAPVTKCCTALVLKAS